MCIWVYFGIWVSKKSFDELGQVYKLEVSTLRIHHCIYVDWVDEHCVKGVRIWSFSGSYFPEFGLNTERYSVFLCIQSECGKMRTRKTPNTDTFHAVGLAPFKLMLIYPSAQVVGSRVATSMLLRKYGFKSLPNDDLLKIV